MLLVIPEAGRACRRVPVHEVPRGEQARAPRAQVLLIDGFLGDSALRFQLEHVIDEVGSFLHHQGGAWHRLATLHGGLRLLVGRLHQIHVGIVVGGGSHHVGCWLLLVVLFLWRINHGRGSNALTAVGIAVICTVLLYRMDVHTGLEVEIPRELVRQSFITAVDVGISAYGGLCSPTSKTLRTWIESHKVLPEHGPA